MLYCEFRRLCGNRFQRRKSYSQLNLIRLKVYHNLLALYCIHDFIYLSGNKKLDEGDYNGAIELYTKAIELDNTNAAFFANR